MEKSLKGKTREFRKACKSVGFKPSKEGEPLGKNECPLRGAFKVQRDGKDVQAADVRLGDQIVELS